MVKIIYCGFCAKVVLNVFSIGKVGIACLSNRLLVICAAELAGIGERRFFSEDGILAFGKGGNFVI